MTTLSEKDIDNILQTDISISELMDHSPLLIAVNDKMGYFRRVSKSWEDVTGFSRKELLGKPWSEFLHPDDLKKSMRQYLEGELFDKRAKQFHGFINRYKVKTGGWVELEWHSTGKNVSGLNLAIAIPRGYSNE